MTNTIALRNKIDEKGLKYNYIAKQLGLSPYGFQLKVDGRNEFVGSEIAKLCEILGITTTKELKAIFFNNVVAK